MTIVLFFIILVTIGTIADVYVLYNRANQQIGSPITHSKTSVNEVKTSIQETSASPQIAKQEEYENQSFCSTDQSWKNYSF